MIDFKTFPANYSLEFNCDLPGTGDAGYRSFKPGPEEDLRPGVGLHGPLIRIKPILGKAWMACFVKGYRGEVVDAVYTTPDPDCVCVVSEGAGYWINVIQQTNINIPVFPIRQVEETESLIIFVDFARLAAFGETGRRWVSEQLVSDHLCIEGIDSNRKRIICRGWSGPEGGDVRREVSLETGKVLYPEKWPEHQFGIL